jgi:hypothetical protein
MEDVKSLVALLLEHEGSRENTLGYFYELINANFERLKMYANPFTTTSIGKISTNF